IAAARSASIPVIYVVIQFREGYPELNVQDRVTVAARPPEFRLLENTSPTEIHPSVAPQAGDVIVTKKRVGAFSGSDLEIVLRATGIKHLVLCGVATSGVVLSTVRYASDMDYELTVLSDGCADAKTDVHQMLMEKVFP